MLEPDLYLNTNTVKYKHVVPKKQQLFGSSLYLAKLNYFLLRDTAETLGENQCDLVKMGDRTYLGCLHG